MRVAKDKSLGRGFIAVPTKALPAAKGEHRRANTTEQRNKRYRRPENRIGSRHIADGGVGRPVVGVRIIFSRTFCSGCPGGPADETGDSANLIRVVELWTL